MNTIVISEFLKSMCCDFSPSNAFLFFLRIAGSVFCCKEAAYFVRFTDNCSECAVVSSVFIFLH